MGKQRVYMKEGSERLRSWPRYVNKASVVCLFLGVRLAKKAGPMSNEADGASRNPNQNRKAKTKTPDRKTPETKWATKGRSGRLAFGFPSGWSK